MGTKIPFNLILLGDIASGKATQAVRLVRKYRMYDFDMGAILRTPKYKKLGRYEEIGGKGKLTPTEVVRKIFREIIPKIKPSQGILFNGTPKMIGESKLVRRLLEKNGRGEHTIFIYISIPEKEIFARAALRREGRKRRADDSMRSLKNRMRYYRTHIRAVKALYRKSYPSAEISGLGTREQVFKRLVAHISRAQV